MPQYQVMLHLETADPEMVNEVVEALSELEELAMQSQVETEEVEAVLQRLSADVPELELFVGYVGDDNEVVVYRAQDGELEGPITLQEGGGDLQGDEQQLLTDYVQDQ